MTSQNHETDYEYCGLSYGHLDDDRRIIENEV